MNVLELKNVTKNYGDFVLDKVSFEVPEGGICGFIGQNGAGKTTTIQLILDIVKKDAGEIRVFGTSTEDKEALTLLKQDIGVVYDEMGFHEFLTPVDIGKMMKLIYRNWDDKVYKKYLESFGLPSGKACGKFSRGMRMKLQIAVAMSHHARLLIMDEPTSGLDPIVRNEILQIFQEFVLEENHTILLSSHITGDLERIADEVVFINKGKIVLAGNKDEILQRHGLMKCRKEELQKVEEEDIVSVRSGSFSVEILAKNRQECGKKYPEFMMEQPSLEDIMLFYVSGKQAEVEA